MSNSEEDSDQYGPSLPSWIKTDKKNVDEDAYGPSLPPHLVQKPPGTKYQPKVSTSEIPSEMDDYCPALPPNLITKGIKDNIRITIKNDIQKSKRNPTSDSPSKLTQSDNDVYTVELPPHLKPAKQSSDHKDIEESNCYGASLPPHLLNKSNGQSNINEVVGPSLPPSNYVPSHNPINYQDGSDSHNEASDDDNIFVGPTPSSSKFDQSTYQAQQIEMRAKKMKDKLTGKEEEKPIARESWMLELPSGKSNLLGLSTAPRQFRKKAVELGDRTVWTDTPADKERKAKMGKNANDVELTPELLATKKRDNELSNLVADYNTAKRGSSLIDMHKVKVKKQKEDEPIERRPFCREDDLNVNKFDEAQKSAILKKARQLDDRFFSGDKRFL